MCSSSWRVPFTKKVGVPLTPLCNPLSKSSRMRPACTCPRSAFETLNVELEPRGVSTKALTCRRATTSVDTAVHLPKPALGASGLDRFARHHPNWVSIDDREVAYDNKQLIPEALAERTDDSRRRLTGGTFEIGVADQLERRLRRTEHVVAQWVRRD